MRALLSALIGTQRSVLCRRCCDAHPEEGVERSVLHELCDDEDGAAPCQDSLQPDHVGVVELAHDGGLAQKVPPLALSVACLQRLDGYQDLSLPRLSEVPTAHLPKLT